MYFHHRLSFFLIIIFIILSFTYSDKSKVELDIAIHEPSEKTLQFLGVHKELDASFYAMRKSDKIAILYNGELFEVDGLMETTNGKKVEDPDRFVQVGDRMYGVCWYKEGKHIYVDMQEFSLDQMNYIGSSINVITHSKDAGDYGFKFEILSSLDGSKVAVITPTEKIRDNTLWYQCYDNNLELLFERKFNFTNKVKHYKFLRLDWIFEEFNQWKVDDNGTLYNYTSSNIYSIGQNPQNDKFTLLHIPDAKSKSYFLNLNLDLTPEGSIVLTSEIGYRIKEAKSIAIGSADTLINALPDTLIIQMSNEKIYHQSNYAFGPAIYIKSHVSVLGDYILKFTDTYRKGSRFDQAGDRQVYSNHIKTTLTLYDNHMRLLDTFSFSKEKELELRSKFPYTVFQKGNILHVVYQDKSKELGKWADCLWSIDLKNYSIRHSKYPQLKGSYNWQTSVGVVKHPLSAQVETPGVSTHAYKYLYYPGLR